MRPEIPKKKTYGSELLTKGTTINLESIAGQSVGRT